MIKIALFAGGTIDSFQMAFDLFIGVDRGSLFLIEQGICPDLAVGDFDSVSEKELALICSQSKEVLQAQPEKDDTDLELAVKAVFARYPQAQVTIFGAFGGRLDHTLANISCQVIQKLLLICSKFDCAMHKMSSAIALKGVTR